LIDARHWERFLRRVQRFIPLICLAASCAFGADGNWPQFRGPSAGGLDDSAPLPVHWQVASNENVAWRTEIPGLGHSSPIIWGDRIYVTTAASSNKAELKVGLYGDIDSADDGGAHEWRLLALDKASGKTLWNTLGCEATPRAKRHPKSSHCSSTPSTDGKHIAAIFGSEGLFCFDMNGKLAWKKDLGPMTSGYYVVPSAEWGFASSPVIHDGKVVVLCDVLTNSFLAAFDLSDGHELWRTPRKDVPTWGTPAIVENGGATQILVNGWHETAAYAFDTGGEIWKLNGGGDIPVPSPIVANGLAYFTSGHGGANPMRAIRLDAHGDITPPQIGATNAAIAWVWPRYGDYMQTPVAVGPFIFGCADWGVVSCFEATTGALQFRERIGNGSEGFSSSGVCDGSHLYYASEIGHVYVLPVTNKFSVLATNDLGETCMASPAISGGTLFYRTRQHLIAIK